MYDGISTIRTIHLVSLQWLTWEPTQKLDSGKKGGSRHVNTDLDFINSIFSLLEVRREENLEPRSAYICTNFLTVNTQVKQS